MPVEMDLSIQQICEAMASASPAVDALLESIPDRVPECPVRIMGSTVSLVVRRMSAPDAVRWEGPVTELRRACEEAIENTNVCLQNNVRIPSDRTCSCDCDTRLSGGSDSRGLRGLPGDA